MSVTELRFVESVSQGPVVLLFRCPYSALEELPECCVQEVRSLRLDRLRGALSFLPSPLHACPRFLGRRRRRSTKARRLWGGTEEKEGKSRATRGRRRKKNVREGEKNAEGSRERRFSKKGRKTSKETYSALDVAKKEGRIGSERQREVGE